MFARMATKGLSLEPAFVPGGSLEPEPLRHELARRRPRDLAAGRTTHGPHRDDLDITLDGRPVRRHASQGQTRVLTLALKVAELDCIREARGTEPILLLDDVSSELDVARTGAVFDLLVGRRGQIFVTTTRPELVPIGRADGVLRLDLRVADGALAPAPSGG
ncbi:MAG: hypothetical protein FJ104_10200 [Deltaproteobacteria bacterium]|nr:hypothetical protein [Deltaproteobacteria bacterium]